MAMKKGTYCGGIRAVEDLRQRCRIDADSGFWLWGLAVSQGSPRVHVNLNGRLVVMRGRRAALFLARGRDLPKGHFAFARRGCYEPICCNPEHCRSGDRKTHGKWVRESGIGSTPAKRAANMINGARRRKLTQDQVLTIRRTAGSAKHFAERFGVSQFAVWQARVGRSWKHLPMQNSVFDVPQLEAA